MFKAYRGNDIRCDLVFDTGGEEDGRMLIVIGGPLEDKMAADVRERAFKVMAAAFNRDGGL